MSTEIKEVKGIASYLATPAIHKNVESVLGKNKVDGFVADIVACVQNNEKLSECTNQSILSGALLAKSISLPLTPQLGYTYLVPYDVKKQNNGKTVFIKEAQFQLGYKGYIQLALRSNMFRKLVATDVRKGEVLGYDVFNDTYDLQSVEFEKRIARDDKGNWLVPIMGYYAKMELVSGFVKEMFMSADDMQKFAETYSKSYRSDLKKHTSYSFWTTRFEEMAKKTMLRQLLGKWGLLTPELERAYISDMAVINEDGNPEYVDNKPDETEPVENPFSDNAIEDAETVEVIPTDIEAEADEVFR